MQYSRGTRSHSSSRRIFSRCELWTNNGWALRTLVLFDFYLLLVNFCLEAVKLAQKYVLFLHVGDCIVLEDAGQVQTAMFRPQKLHSLLQIAVHVIDQLFYCGTLYAALSLDVIKQVAQLLLLKILRAWLSEFLCGKLIPQFLYLPAPGTRRTIRTDSWRCLQESYPLFKLSGRDQLSIIKRCQSAILLDRYVHGVVDVEIIMPFKFDLLPR